MLYNNHFEGVHHEPSTAPNVKCKRAMRSVDFLIQELPFIYISCDTSELCLA